jgi:hypothetical protein
MCAFRRVRALALAAALAAAGCGGRAAAGSDSPTVLEVENRATLDMNVYALSDAGGRERLGTARSLSTTRLTIPDRLVLTSGSLRFQADPVGSTRVHFSEQVPILPGDTVVIQIPPT